jgi:S-adenosylmethionine decarboxylase
MKSRAAAVHILLDLFGCPPELLGDSKLIREALQTTAEENRLTVLSEVFHRFEPHGVSGVLLISESHISIHTWPEYGYAAVDVLSCNPEVSAEMVQSSVEKKLRPSRVEVRVLPRGEAKKTTQKESQ